MHNQRSCFVAAWFVMFLFLYGCAGETQSPPSQEEVSQTEIVKAEPNSNPQDVENVVEEAKPEPADDLYQGLPTGFTEEGYPYLGDPEAPVTLEEYSDFLCPFCGRHFSQTLPALMESYLKNGEVKYVFRDLPLVGLHPTAPAGHEAARCVAEQGAGYFWTMHEALFSRQGEWSQLPDPSDFLKGVAEETGVDMNAYQECQASGEAAAEVQASVAAGEALGFNGTPSFQFISDQSEATYTLIGAQPLDMFNQWVDALLAGEEPPREEQAEAEPPELPFWANQEGLAPDPERPGYTLAGDQYKGDPNAKLVVIEFSDFQCPACQRHALETQPLLDETFVDKGQVLWVYKHFPLQIHPQAPAAAAAAECAAEQGAFWEMHHALFEGQERWAVTDPDPQLISLAEALDLHMAEFTACLNSRQPLENVLSDVFDAQGVVQSTPTFIGIYGGKGAVFRGARESEDFVTLLEDLLEQAEEAAP